MQSLKELREYLEKEKQDLLKLRENSDLTEQGQGQLQMINAILEKIGQENEHT